MAQETKKVNITIEAGANFQMYFTVRDDAERLIDLTGCTVEAQLREYAEASDYLEFTATHNGSGGRVSISMPFEDTAAIPYDSGVYDVYITDTNNIREKYLEGDVEITPAVTKPVAGEIIYLLSFASEDDFPSYGMVRRLYFSHATNHMYRWNGTDYVDIVTDGEAATVEVGDVETLPAGSDATVENVGSLLNAVFDFGIPEGNGIASIEKTGTDVLTDTYTVTFTDPSVEAFDFDVTNGKGIVSIAEVVSGLTHTFTVTFNDGDTFTYTLTDGNGIVSVEKTGATDNVDHYRITFDDGTYFDYNVTNVDTSEYYDKDEIDTLLADKADVGDSYTKDEEDALLADKADSADLGDLASKDTVDWDSDIDNIPSTFPPEGHIHDDRYYTETEMDSLLADKADADDVYTKDDVDDALADKADSADVYTKDETDEMLLDKAPVILSSASGSIASFADGSPAPVTALSVGIEPVQSGTGDPSPENVRPISGRTSAKVTRVGKNVLDWSNFYTYGSKTRSSATLLENGDINFKNTNSSNYGWIGCATSTNNNEVSPSNCYTISAKKGDTFVAQFECNYYGVDKDNIVREIQTGVNANAPYTITNENVVKVAFRCSGRVVGAGNTGIAGKAQIERSSSASDYQPYNEQTVTIDLDGTRYGGVIDVLTGEMTVTKVLADLATVSTWYTRTNTHDNGIYIFTRGASSVFGYSVKAAWGSSYGAISSFSGKSNADNAYNGNGIGFAIDNSGVLYVSTNSATTVNEFKTFLSTANWQICAELATPLTVTLSPSQIQTLLGENHIWADTGDVAVEYRADTKRYIDQKIAETLDAVKKAKQIITDVTTEMVAPRNLAEGDYVIVGDDLLKTTATVASGSTLTIGINCVKTTVAEVLIALATASE